MRVVINVRYDARASENKAFNVFDPRTRKRRYGITREARAWRDEVIYSVSPYRGIFGPETRVVFQIISNGAARGDTANFTKLVADALAKGLGLPSDCKFDIQALPRVREDTKDSYIRIELENNDVS